MTVIGEPGIWADTFPDDLVPRLLDLVTETWADFERPGEAELEVAITRRFKRALKQSKDRNKIPVRIERESTEDDPDTGEERGRIDRSSSPARYERRFTSPSSVSGSTRSKTASAGLSPLSTCQRE